MSLLHHSLAFADHRLPIPGIVFHIRRAGDPQRFEWVADSIQPLTGYPAAMILADPELFSSLVHPADLPRLLHHLRRREAPAAAREVREGPGEEEEPESIEYRIIRRDGETRWLRESNRSIPGLAAEPVGVWMDITETKLLEERVRQLEERQRQAQRIETLGALAGGIAHDFNNLLTAIVSSAHLISEQGELSSQALQDLVVIRTAAERGGALARQILGFSARAKRDAGGGSAGETDLTVSLRELETILLRTLGEDIALRVEIAEGLPPVQADGVEIDQIILNLAVSAREAMTAGGRLEIEVDSVHNDGPAGVEGGSIGPGDYLRIRIEDSGPGIPEEIRDRIFEPYVSTKAEGEGGLGLATVRRIVGGAGGGVRLFSEVGVGTTFEIFLPVARMTRHPMPRAVPARPIATGGEGGAHVLVVEDDPEVRDVIERTLLRFGHSVASAGSASEAVRVYERTLPPVQVVLSDVVLPDRTGPELLVALRRRNADLPFVHMSGYGEETLIARGAMGKGTLFLGKPFHPDELDAVIRAAVAGSGAGETRTDRSASGEG